MAQTIPDVKVVAAQVEVYHEWADDEGHILALVECDGEQDNQGE